MKKKINWSSLKWVPGKSWKSVVGQCGIYFLFSILVIMFVQTCVYLKSDMSLFSLFQYAVWEPVQLLCLSRKANHNRVRAFKIILRSQCCGFSWHLVFAGATETADCHHRG